MGVYYTLTWHVECDGCKRPLVENCFGSKEDAKKGAMKAAYCSAVRLHEGSMIDLIFCTECTRTLVERSKAQMVDEEAGG